MALLPPKKLSNKALQFLAADHPRLTFLEGAVRSGKTILSILSWIFFIIAFSGPGPFLMVGKTERTLMRNVLDPMIKILGQKSVVMNRYDGVLYVQVLGGKTLYLAGANDERSEGKIRGLTLAGAYCDEVTLYPESFFTMLLSRLSEPGSKLFATMNPDSPYHWMKTRYLDHAGEIGAAVWHFLLDDNKALDPEYVIALKREYTGLWFQRYILGLWVLAEGVVYPMWREDLHVKPTPPGDIPHKIISVDYGVNNPAVFLLMGRHIPTGRIHVCKEFYHDSTTSSQWTDSQLANELQTFMTRDVRYVVCDPSATSFIVELRKRGIRVKEAINDVIPGIQEVSNLLSNDMLAVDPSCYNLKREFGAYVWDSKAQNRGEDKPVKAHDHCSDCLRYGCADLKQAHRPQVSSPGGKPAMGNRMNRTAGGGRFAGL
ncbi:MAG TPA: PBSX family phage terminase large subunit [Methanospirillum sp.]|nr:PBSX family phage terminase large subunit [Methanospirillum sp.]